MQRTDAVRLTGNHCASWLISALLAALLSACGSAVPTPQSAPSPSIATPTAAATPSPATTPPPPAVALVFRSLAVGQAAVYDQPSPLVVVVGEQARLQPVWNQRFAREDPPPALQQLDFGRDLLVFVSYGRRNTGGYGITVKGVERQGNEIAIAVETRNPLPGSLLPQVITTPWEAIAIERATLPNWATMRFVVSDATGRMLAETVPQTAGSGP